MKIIDSENGQVTIPKKLRERLGIKNKTVLEFHEENGRLIAEKAVMDDPVTKVTGCLKLDKDTDMLVAKMRGTFIKK